jgi:uroporphyrinogen decarboxylase
MKEIKNDLLLKVLGGEVVERPPVWMMRQAGRYLPDFMKLKEKYDFFVRCQTPELAGQITLMPIDQIGVDAAILFSDILVVPQAMGLPFEMKPEVGPFLQNPIKSKSDIDTLIIPEVEESLDYVFEAIKWTLRELDGRVPLIGFAGSPWTIMCYAVEGRGTKAFDKARAMCFSQPQWAHALLQKITDTTIAYLKAKVRAGVHVVQLFDSWGGLLSPKDYNEFSWPYLEQIINALESEIPLIVYGKGCWFALSDMAKSKASAVGIDWTVTADEARKRVGNKVIQGNLDPAFLMAPEDKIRERAHRMIDSFGPQNYIANLGHGILPSIRVDHARAFVDAVKNYSRS